MTKSGATGGAKAPTPGTKIGGRHCAGPGLFNFNDEKRI